MSIRIRNTTGSKRAQGTPQRAHDELEARFSKLTDDLESAKKHLAASEKAMEDRLRFERFLSEVSSRFVNLSPDRVDLEIEQTLKRLLEFFEVDRCELVKTFPNKTSWQVTHAAAAEDVPPIPPGVELMISIRPWAYDKLIRKREVLSFSRIDDLPAEATMDRQAYAEWGIRSALNIPIIIGGQVDHIIAFDSVKRERVWPEEFIPRLRLLGEIFVNALEYMQDKLRLEDQRRFEMLLVEISGRFVNLSADKVDGEIVDAQRRVCECLGLDLSSLWQWSMETPRIYKMTHIYRPFGGPPFPEPMYAQEHFPWCQEQLEAGRLIVVSSIEDVPFEAARDRETWRHFGIKTSLTFPLAPGGGQVIGALSFNTVQAERTWPETLIMQLQLVAQIFANALISKQNETMLRESEARLSLITETVGAGLWIMDVETKKVWVSPKSRELFHFGPDEEINYESYFRAIHPEDRDRIHQDVQQALQSGDELRCDYRIMLPDGNTRWIGARGRFLKSNGKSDRLLGLSLDITERKQIELRFKNSEASLNTLINSTPDLIWSVDAKRFGLLTFNRGLYDYFLHCVGLPIEVGMRPEDLFKSEEYVRIWHSFYHRLLNEGSFTTDYGTYRGNRTLRMNFNILKNDDAIFGISVFAQDITELKRMENQLREHLAEIEKLKSQLEKENIYLREELGQRQGFGKIVGSSDALNYVLFRVRQVAVTDATVLILGETGTGKGMVADAIHSLSPRKERAMITVNCAALPENLIESELFGREKGAFTGAHARQAGRFEAADGGTIFLDEIGELPKGLQSKLLRVLQDGEFERLGSAKTVKVDVRVIASTSRDLKAEMQNGRFREDLFFRLNVFPVTLPPLRKRSEDIPQLVHFFVEKYARKFGRKIETIPKDTIKKLQNYSWPGNVRELEHLIERGVITSPGSVFHLADPLEPVSLKDEADASLKDLAAMEREHILRALRETDGKIEGPQGAAAILKLHPSTLRFRIKKLGIKRG